MNPGLSRARLDSDECEPDPDTHLYQWQREPVSSRHVYPCAWAQKHLKKACLFRLNLTLANANASVCNFLCQFPTRESTCKMLLLKPCFTPRVLLKITFTPISSCVFLVPRHFYPLKHTCMCAYASIMAHRQYSYFCRCYFLLSDREQKRVDWPIDVSANHGLRIQWSENVTIATATKGWEENNTHQLQIKLWN